MRRCVECQKKLFPLLSVCLLSRFGWTHIECLDERIRKETLAVLEKAISELEDDARALYKEHS
jgi:hypothetical protein